VTDRLSVYIAGPMTGVEDLNYPLFNLVAEALRDDGFEVVNPAELQHNRNPEATEVEVTRAEYMTLDLPYVIACDILCLLPDWEQSRGANVELLVALSCGNEVWELVEDDESAVFLKAPEARPSLWRIARHVDESAELLTS